MLRERRKPEEIVAKLRQFLSCESNRRTLFNESVSGRFDRRRDPSDKRRRRWNARPQS
jgi:hypothetical protein